VEILLGQRAPRDCPWCESAGAVFGRVCQVCDEDVLPLEGATNEVAGSVAAVGADHRTTGLPPAVLVRNGDGAPDATRRLVHPSVPLRFADVVKELEDIAEMATECAPVDGERVADACRRAGSLLRVLRAQFFQDVVAWDGHPSRNSAPIQ
jgi:hypothetical protein